MLSRVAVFFLLNAPPPPLISVSPASDYSILTRPVRYPPISEVAFTNTVAGGIELWLGGTINTGTFPIQSERMYHAIRGNGGTVRLVMLPLESHGYSGRESIEHVLWEELKWFDKYLRR